jgi:hypothetical protein
MRLPTSVSGTFRQFVRDADEGAVVFLTFSNHNVTLQVQGLGTPAFFQNVKGGS